MPFFDGLMTGEIDALIGSFAGEPELHHPVRGRIKGVAAFARFVTDTDDLAGRAQRHRRRTSTSSSRPRRGVEEFVLHLDGDDGRIELPVALAADHDEDGRMIELRIYFSALAADRRPRDPAAGAAARPRPATSPTSSAITSGRSQPATSTRSWRRSSPTATVREPAGGDYTHRGADELRALYERFFSNGGGIPLEHCAVTDDGRACALEYNVVAWGRRSCRPQAGLAVYVRGDSGKTRAPPASTTTPTRR